MLAGQIKKKTAKSKSESEPIDPIEADLKDLLNNCRKKMKTFNEVLITKAFLFSVNAHKNYFRRSGEAYYKHTLEVAKILINELTLDDISIASALLHDVLDYGDNYSLKDIKKEFGTTIAEILEGLSKIGHIESQTSEDIEIDSYNRLLISMFKDVRIILIKLADRLHNMRTLEYLPPEKQLHLAKETFDIYCPIANRIGLGSFKWELEDLAFKYLHREDYKKISDKMSESRAVREEFVKKLVAPIKDRLNKDELLKMNEVSFEISGRPKHFYSIYSKMKSRGLKIDQLNDLSAVRIVLDTDDQNWCFYVYGIVCNIYPPIPGTFKDYIYNPKKNGYQSIHTAVLSKEGRNVEVQIRTKRMHELAEKGYAAHFIYKGRDSKTETLFEEKNIKVWIESVREVFETAKEETAQELLESVKRNLFLEEIYVFTPNKELKRLPRDSTPLDFAFHIHSELGVHCLGTKVNGKIVPLDYKLKNGDTVEILTSNKQEPNSNWLNYVATSKAKSAILKFIKEKNKELEEKGRRIWREKAKDEKLKMSDKEFDSLLRTMRFNDLSEFYIGLANSEFNLDRVWEFISYKAKGTTETAPNGNHKKSTSFDSLSSGKKKITDESNYVSVEQASCCYPLPGDKIMGIINGMDDIIIHRRECPVVQELFRSRGSSIVELDWAAIAPNELITEIVVSCNDEPDILKNITNILIESGNTSIKGISFDRSENELNASLVLSIQDLVHFKNLRDTLCSLDGIRAVRRKELSVLHE